MHGEITVLILTFNEEANIARTLDAVRWAHRILVVDSGSIDGTLDIITHYPNTEVLKRPFDSFAQQCNFGLRHVQTPWVLSIDADYRVTETLAHEILALSPGSDVSGYSVSFLYSIYGRSLRGTLYPPRTVLFRPERAFYSNEGHGHRVEVQGKILRLREKFEHDDRKPLARWLSSQQAYARREADHLLAIPASTLNRADRIRLLIWVAPLLVFPYTLIVKGLLLDGRHGLFYAFQRLLFEIIVALELLDRGLRDEGDRQ